MIRRTVKIQLAAFIVISLVGIVYIGTNYVGFHLPWSAKPYTLKLRLPQSGGIFTNAEVTERGVTIGRVGPMHIRRDGVEVELRINPGHEIPSDVRATIANLSAVGEQYVDLAPQRDGGPYLKPGDVIPAASATLPLSNAKFLLDVDNVVRSVDTEHLTTVIEELGRAFQDVAPALQALIDNGNRLTEASIRNLPQQLQLIHDSRTVLDTQRAVSAELRSWAASFAAFSAQLKQSDPALRGIFDSGVRASRQLDRLLRDNRAALPTLLGNLITVNRIQAVRLPYVHTVLELFPSLAAGGFYVTPGDGTAHFGMVSDNTSSPCLTGYESTKIRGNNDDGNSPSDWGGPANLDAYCHGAGITTDQRGSRNVPRPDNAQITNSDPYPGPTYGKSRHPTVREQLKGSRSSAARERIVSLPYDPLTGLLTGVDGKTYQLGYSGPLAPIFGSNSWEWLLLAPTMR